MPQRPHRTSRERALLLTGLLLLLAGTQVARAEEAGPAAKPADPLLIGVHSVSVEQVVDGDTIRLPDGKGSIRLLALDTEEVARSKAGEILGPEDPSAPWHAGGFAAYAAKQRGESKWPVKYGTPAGAAATDFLRSLVTGCKSMRLEREHAGARARGHYGRVLAYVFLEKDGKRINVSEAMIRAGHSPYFVKYGRSARFDKLFRAAQAEARKAKRGIWGDGGPGHYPDYAERLTWWAQRADQVERWALHKPSADHVTLGEADANAKLQKLVGKEAVVFGALDRELEVKSGDKRIFLLSHERRRGFPLVIFDADVARKLDERQSFHAMYVTVRGTVTLYRGRPQMVVESTSQVSTK
ncbi:MAG: thermonuclease family protein [Planctomycetota bacterium]|nr:thermonuclease family protein [Planctomycetota bacterium]